MASILRQETCGVGGGRGAVPLRILLAAAALAAGCAHAPPGGDGAPPRAPPLTLHFAWPEGFKAEVLARHEAEAWGSDPVRALSRRLLSTSHQGRQLLVATRAVDAPLQGADAPSAVRLSDALGEVVAPDGAFLRAEGLDAAVARAGEMGRVTQRAALARSVATDWEFMVGAWAGQTFTEGQVRHKRFRGSVPLLPTAESLLDVELGFDGRIPCTPEDQERRCVELHYRGRTAPENRAATLARVAEAIAGSPGHPVPEDFHGHFEVTVITEPDTLVPHRIVDRESLRLRVRLDGGRIREAEERSEDEYLFTVPVKEDARRPDAAETASSL